MEYTWLYEERLPHVIIREFNPSEEPIHTNGEEPFYIEQESIIKLVQLIDDEFNKEEILNLLM